ncbi:MAG: UDP-N-acetylglucosamine acyltransferase [Candidatus Eremiobacteraeota bacterium]|nr:UDP-N-acetylglucosamine acyltransferase [Candidatus Eremiobacteraeota bacterium]
MSANKVHPTAYIGASVKLGSGNIVGAFAFIDGDVTIGNGNWIGPHVTIGTPAQYSTGKFEFTGEPAAGIRIGDRNILREYMTVHQPSRNLTIIEDDCYVMAYCHVSHDTRICRGAIITNNAQIGGHSEIQQFAFIGLSCVTHQFSTIGAYAFVGMGSIVAKDVPPFMKAFGNPVRLAGVNTVGLARNGFKPKEIEAIEEAVARRQMPQGVGELIDEVVAKYERRTAETKRASAKLRVESGG